MSDYNEDDEKEFNKKFFEKMFPMFKKEEPKRDLFEDEKLEESTAPINETPRKTSKFARIPNNNTNNYNNSSNSLPTGNDLLNNKNIRPLTLPKDCVYGNMYGRECIIKTVTLKNTSDIMLEADINIIISSSQRDGFTLDRVDYNPIDMAKYIKTGREKFSARVTLVKYI